MLLFFYSKISCHVKDTYYLGVVSQICHRIHVRIRTVWVLNYYNINLVFKFFFTFLTGSIQLIQNKQVFLSLHQIHTNYQVKTICYCFDMFANLVVKNILIEFLFLCLLEKLNMGSCLLVISFSFFSKLSFSVLNPSSHDVCLLIPFSLCASDTLQIFYLVC